ncbi:MAG: cytochrome c biogenesis protein CcsA [Verrucomicrobiota bacterium]
MDRIALVVSTLCFLFGFAYTMYALGARVYRSSPLNLFVMLAGFGFQMLWLYQRGQVVGRCPLGSLFDVLVFLAWSVVLLYLLTGQSYRLSLLGTFTSPLVFLLQGAALLMPLPGAVANREPIKPWLELHAAVSVVAYGAFALAAMAGAMWLVQERQLKTRRLRSFFYDLPPIHDLAVANRRLVYIGFGLLSVGLLAGMSNGVAHIGILRVVSVGVWLLYAFLCVALRGASISPRRASWLAIGAFTILLLTVWAVETVERV